MLEPHFLLIWKVQQSRLYIYLAQATQPGLTELLAVYPSCSRTDSYGFCDHLQEGKSWAPLSAVG